MPEDVTLIIDGQSVNALPGSTILAAAASAGIEIPTICAHEVTSAKGLCRICVVEVEGARTLVAACVARVSQGMRVRTRSERVDRARRTILELLASSVDLSEAPDIQRLMNLYNANPERIGDVEKRAPGLIDDNPMFVRDYGKCVLCLRCVQVCGEDTQYTFAIGLTGRGFDSQISTFFNRPLPETSCVFCGQCISVCPSGALKPKREWLMERTRAPRKRRRAAIEGGQS